MKINFCITLLIGSLVGLLLLTGIGCETAIDPAGTLSSADLQGVTSSPSGGEGDGEIAVESDDGEGLFAKFNWKYGGFNGSRAKLDAPRITMTGLSSGSVSFRWDVGMRAWGLSDGDAGAIFAVFVKNSAGEWVGGKIDWISVSRKSRDFAHIHSGYNGWTLAGVPNPCEAAFVVVNSGGSKRSNVITGTWKR